MMLFVAPPTIDPSLPRFKPDGRPTTVQVAYEKRLQTFLTAIAGGPAIYMVATLPTGTSGAMAFASDGRKIGEAAGAGTGVVVAYSNGAWRRVADDAAVVS